MGALYFVAPSEIQRIRRESIILICSVSVSIISPTTSWTLSVPTSDVPNMRTLAKIPPSSTKSKTSASSIRTASFARRAKNAKYPIDSDNGAAYSHNLQGAGHMGSATIMLSCMWGYTIGDIVDVLTNYCKSNGLKMKEVNMWICCLCVNQHRFVKMKKRKEEIGSSQ